MRTFLRAALASVISLAFFVGPVSAATTQAITIAQAAQTGTVTGQVTGDSGQGISGATVLFDGPGTHQTVETDDSGNFSTAVPAGLYTVTVTRAGFQTGSSDVAVPAGASVNVNVAITAATLSTIQTIGSVTSRSGFNTSAAAVQTISSQAFKDQGQSQIVNVLNEIPGVFTESPGTGGNNADAGSIRFTSIRGSFGNETLALIDGHPVANGEYGDFVSSWQNSFLLQDAEVVKGPGASAPQVINAIGGTVNFRTLDPTPKMTGYLEQGFDLSEGGSHTNLLFSGTTNNGKFGWVAGYTVQGSNGPLGTNDMIPVQVPTYALINGAAIKTPPFTTNTNNVGPAVINQPSFNSATLYACCVPIYSNFVDRGTLLKGVYHLSDTTSITGTFYDTEAYADQNGNHDQAWPTAFAPGASFAAAGGVPAGFAGGLFQYNTGTTFITPQYEDDHEPTFSAELRTALGNNTMILRGYSTNISRLQLNPDGNANATQVIPLNLYGTVSTSLNGGPTTPQTFTGQTALISLPPSSPYCAASPIPIPCTAAQVAAGQQIGYGSVTYYNNAEEDRLRGGSFEFDHPLGSGGDLITASYDIYENSSHTYNYANDPDYVHDVIPVGSYQSFGTALVRGIFDLTPQLNATLSNYITTYTEHSTQNYGTTWTQSSTSRYDPRLGLTLRVTPDISLRAAAGSAISYPYLAILDGANSAAPTGYAPATATTAAFASNTLGNPNIQPETSMGYDLGFDARIPGSSVVLEGDVFRTNLFNQFLTATYGNGTVGPLCPTSGGYAPNGAGTLCVGTGAATAPYITVPLYTTQTINLGDARYDGLELSAKSDPALGFGFNANLTLLHAYDYNISPCLYSKTPNCTNPLVNLAVVNGVNFIGSLEGGNLPAGASLGDVQNHSIPYASAYGEVHFRFLNNGLFLLNAQLYGNNNSLNVPAFWVFGTSARVGVGDKGNTALQLTVYNLLGAYPNGYSTYSGGVLYPVANGQEALSAANSIGPPQYTISLSHRFGQ